MSSGWQGQGVAHAIGHWLPDCRGPNKVVAVTNVILADKEIARYRNRLKSDPKPCKTLHGCSIFLNFGAILSNWTQIIFPNNESLNYYFNKPDMRYIVNSGWTSCFWPISDHRTLAGGGEFAFTNLLLTVLASSLT
jgi:hypothetical protein